MGNKGEMKTIHILIVLVFAVGISVLALNQLGLLGQTAPATIGGIVTPSKLGKLELISTTNPIYCPPSAEISCDKSAYTANCADSNPDSINVVENSPTEDVKCGPARFVVSNTGDGPVNSIKFGVYSQDPNKVKGMIDTGKSGWDGTSWTLSTLAAGDTVTFNTWCYYEGGQTSANERVVQTFTGVAGSGAKSGYTTITAQLNCTA